MQSELSGHVGLNGNLFCRICKVKEPVPSSSQNANKTSIILNDNSQVGSSYDTASNRSSISSSATAGNNVQKKVTMSGLVNHARDFLMVCGLVSVIIQ